MIKQQVEKDLKQAMIDGDKDLVMALRNIKSAILYIEVERGKREEGLDDDSIVNLLLKEAKKRQDSADMYKQGGAQDRATAELNEKQIIEKYLPAPMSEQEIEVLIDEVTQSVGGVSRQNMGQIISQVKSKAGGSADGGTIAKLIQKRL